MELRPALRVVAAKLAASCSRANVDYVLIGGFGAGAYGSSIDTKDVDACVALSTDEEPRIEALLTALKEEGFRINVEALKRRAGKGRTILFLMLGLVRLDVMLRKPDGWWDDALRHRRRIEWAEGEFSVAAPEDIAILKLAAGREKDFDATRLMLAKQFRRLDLDRLRASAKRLSGKVPELPARVEKVLAEAAEIDRLASLPRDDDV